MKARIEISDLNARQWEHLVTKVPVDGRTFIPGLPRVCASFESPGSQELHIEMDTVDLAGLLVRLESIRDEVAVAAIAALTPDALPDHLEQVRNAADPARQYDPDFADRLENGAYDR